MAVCLECLREVELSPAKGGFRCPHCGARDVLVDEPGHWVSVARFTSVAEAGYFADRLTAEQIDCQVQECGDFNAVHGFWERAFVLRVPAESGTRAAQMVEMEIAREEGIGGAEAAPRYRRSREGAPSLVAPVVLFALGLSALAGAIAYTAMPWALKWVASRQPVAPTSDSALWQALVEAEGPLVEASAPGKKRRALWHDRNSGRIILDEDSNGDGRIDHRREFKGGQLVRETRR